MTYVLLILEDSMQHPKKKLLDIVRDKIKENTRLL